MAGALVLLFFFAASPSFGARRTRIASCPSPCLFPLIDHPRGTISERLMEHLRPCHRHLLAGGKTQMQSELGILLFHAIAAKMGPRKGSEASPADGIPASSTEPIISLLETEQCPLDSLAQTAPGLTQMSVNGRFALCTCLVHYLASQGGNIPRP